MPPNVTAPASGAATSAAVAGAREPGARLKLIGIAMVGNEADIVEAFVRDNLAYLDHLVVAEHNTFDGTREILAALLDEGLPLTIRRIQTPAFWQAVVTNELLQEAMERFDPHWIVPLDADEFLEAKSRAALEAELARMTSCHGRLRWIHHVPTESDDDREEHPGRRIRHRYAYPTPDPALNPYVWKLMLNGRLIGPYLDRYDLEKGSHRVVFKGVRLLSAQPVRVLAHAVLRHYPVRSFDQLTVKAGLAMLQGSLAGRNEVGGTHAPRLHRLVVQGKREVADLQSAVREYLDTGRFSSDDLVTTPIVIEPKRHCSALRHGGRRYPAAATYLRWIDAHGGASTASGAMPAQPARAATATIRYDYCPWLFWHEASDEARREQLALQAHWSADGRLRCGTRCYVSPQAGVVPDKVEMGDECYIAAQAYVTGDLATGRQCTINPFAVVRGQVTMGDHVRVGAHASILGFSHNHARLDVPIHEQGLSSKGIRIGDDVWIGSGALLLDGIHVGSHCIIAAGAVVTKDVADWSVVAGNPARTIRDRRERRVALPRAASLAQTLGEFGRRAAEQWPDIIRRCEIRDGGRIGYTDVPGTRPVSIRPLADAIEIAAAFGALPPGQSATELVERLRACQDIADGMPNDPLAPPGPNYSAAQLNDGNSAYMVLSVGYALMCLGSHFSQPLKAVQRMGAARLHELLGRQPWRREAWTAGAWVDAVGTAVWMNRHFFGLPGPVGPLFAWLQGACNPETGLWGERRSSDGWLQPVNGFYRLTRGTYAQFDAQLPYPEAALDTILTHIRMNAGFEALNINACNLLDVVHPLWLLSRATAHRRDEVMRFVERQLSIIPGRWVDGAGFAFAPGVPPGLQGTEMWLAIVATGVDLLGMTDALPYAPRGVHRLMPEGPHPAADPGGPERQERPPATPPK